MSRRANKSNLDGTPPFRRANRPIDKKLISVLKSSTGTAQVATVLLTTTIPCTITGLRWTIGYNNLVATGPINVRWGIIVVRDGLAANTLSGTDGGDFYTPESDMLAFGSHLIGETDTAGPQVINVEGSTKTMRKMMAGDLLTFIVVSDTAASLQTAGTVQFFCKF